jgi:hypothetical protein
MLYCIIEGAFILVIAGSLGVAFYLVLRVANKNHRR